MAKTRRPKGTGSIYQRGNKFYGRIRTGRYKSNGKPEIIYFSGTSKMEVQKQMNKFDLDSHIDPVTTSFETYAKKWLVTYKMPTMKASSYDTLEGTFKNQIFPCLGMLRISEIKTKDIQEMLNGIKKAGLSYSRVKKTYDGTNMVMKHALSQKDIATNPIEGVIMPAESTFPKKEMIWYDENEARLIIEECRRLYPNSETPKYLYGDAYILQLNTGTRRGEIVGLKKRDWDKENHILYIRENVQTVKTRDDEGNATGYETVAMTTKTYSGYRKIPLNEMAENALQRMFDRNPNSEYIVCAKNGGVLAPQQYDRTFRRIINNTKINKGSTHSLRHTFANRLFRNKIDIKTISTLMGHASVQITLDTYIHFAEAEGYLAVKTLDNL